MCTEFYYLVYLRPKLWGRMLILSLEVKGYSIDCSCLQLSSPFLNLAEIRLLFSDQEMCCKSLFPSLCNTFVIFCCTSCIFPSQCHLPGSTCSGPFLCLFSPKKVPIFLLLVFFFLKKKKKSKSLSEFRQPDPFMILHVDLHNLGI